MNAASLRKLAALNLSAEQMAGVLDILADGAEAEEARRSAQRERTRRAREKQRGNVTVTAQTRYDRGYDTRGGDAPVEDKPLPQKVEEQKESKGVAKAKPSRLPSDFLLPDEWRDWAVAKGLPPERVPIEFEKICNWAANATGSKGAKADWFRAWKNWVIGAIDELPRNRGPTVNGTPTLAKVFGLVKEKAAENGQAGEVGSGFREAIHDLPVLRRAQ